MDFWTVLALVKPLAPSEIFYNGVTELDFFSLLDYCVVG